MRINILTAGSRGDVQPYIALGVGLRGAGYDVRITTHASFESFVRSWGLDFHPLPGDPVAMIESLMRVGADPVNFAMTWTAFFTPLMEQILHEMLVSCQDSDVLLYTILTLVPYHIAEQMRIPGIRVGIYPTNPSRYLPSPLAVLKPLENTQSNLLSHTMTNYAQHAATYSCQ
jgi:UDP:flavonoid glycosyltransferase YjiC (YdhE family)